MGGSLTVSERILYHLHSYTKYEDKYEVPFHLTQDGISQSCGISRAHAAIELKKLKSAQLVDERLSHVRRGKTRRKVYLLTFEGKSKAGAIHQYVCENKIDPALGQVRNLSGETEASSESYAESAKAVKNADTTCEVIVESSRTPTVPSGPSAPHQKGNDTVTRPDHS